MSLLVWRLDTGVGLGGDWLMLYSAGSEGSYLLVCCWLQPPDVSLERTHRRDGTSVKFFSRVNSYTQKMTAEFSATRLARGWPRQCIPVHAPKVFLLPSCQNWQWKAMTSSAAMEHLFVSQTKNTVTPSQRTRTHARRHVSTHPRLGQI